MDHSSSSTIQCPPKYGLVFRSVGMKDTGVESEAGHLESSKVTPRMAPKQAPQGRLANFSAATHGDVRMKRLVIRRQTRCQRGVKHPPPQP